MAKKKTILKARRIQMGLTSKTEQGKLEFIIRARNGVGAGYNNCSIPENTENIWGPKFNELGMKGEKTADSIMQTIYFQQAKKQQDLYASNLQRLKEEFFEVYKSAKPDLLAQLSRRVILMIGWSEFKDWSRGLRV